MGHTCHATRCTTEVPPRLFMCKKHWSKLTTELQDAIWANYVPGQERRKDPTDAYLDAAFEAIRWLEQSEGLVTQSELF